MARYWKLYRSYLAMAFKSRLSYRVDAVVGIFAFFLNNAVSLLVLVMTIQNIDTLAGWTFMNMAFLYGCLLIPKGIDHVFTDAIWQIGLNYVKLGKLDRFLIRPVNPLFQLIAEMFQHEGLGEVILGVALIIISAPYQNITWTFGALMGLIVCEFFAIFLFTAIKLITATVAFWTKVSIQFMTNIYNLSSYVRYPVEALGKVVKILLFYIVPFGLIIYWPVSCLYSGTSLLLPAIICPLVCISLLIISYLFWQYGLKHYESAGS